MNRQSELGLRSKAYDGTEKRYFSVLKFDGRGNPANVKIMDARGNQIPPGIINAVDIPYIKGKVQVRTKSGKELETDKLEQENKNGTIGFKLSWTLRNTIGNEDKFVPAEEIDRIIAVK